MKTSLERGPPVELAGPAHPYQPTAQAGYTTAGYPAAWVGDFQSRDHQVHSWWALSS